MGNRGGLRPRRIIPGQVPAWVSGGRWGLRRARVEQCAAVLAAELVYDRLLRDGEQLRPGSKLKLASSRSPRTIALPAMAVRALKRHRVRQLEMRMAAGQQWQDSGFIFTTPIGTTLDARNITRTFKTVLRAQNLPMIRIHDLRHSCATLMLAQGVSPRVVMETLGHSQISLTLNTYSHVLPAMQEDAAARMDEILSGSKR